MYAGCNMQLKPEIKKKKTEKKRKKSTFHAAHIVYMTTDPGIFV